MTVSIEGPHSRHEIQKSVDEYIDSLKGRLYQLNKSIHENPELAYKEYHAHDAICSFLEELGFKPTRHAYGLETAFEVISGSDEGRCVNFNAEYDALPGIGHACGHNLIATASVTGFIALAHVISKFGIREKRSCSGPLLKRMEAGRSTCLTLELTSRLTISLGASSIACYDIVCTYEGVSAHSAANPHEGINALDAVVSAYNNISMLRQQIRPDERIHGTILQAPKITNAIPEHTATKYSVRSPTIKGVQELGKRVCKCMEAGALATGCKLKIEESPIYADLRLNQPLCDAFQAHMGDQGEKIFSGESDGLSGSTDQGNVTYAIPGLHALIGIPVTDDANNHTHGFAAAAGTEVAHERTLKGGKAMAMTGLDILTDDDFYARVIEDFEKDKKRR
ncbi:peptidase M20D [Coccidioides immitis H538.4]|uniref:Peptidase M20 domain-containing protein 2 n=1 Tax=Coccidioides immitis H538.4 TaxID=396776 RepID=A0A0J8RYU4_COCIT|nr:peptidase M20D [Coccidioides immitis H538.4]